MNNKVWTFINILAESLSLIERVARIEQRRVLSKTKPAVYYAATIE